MKIYLIRHGQTTGDLEDRYGGDYDDHLTEDGIKQSRELVQKLKHSGIEMIYCSPKLRAKETAQIISKEIGCRVDVINDVRERNMYGILTGMVKSEAKEKHPEHVGALKNHRHAVPESESYDHFGKRITKALDAITKRPYQTIAILSHGGPISFIFREILKLGEVKIEDCGFVELEKVGDNYMVVKMDGIELKMNPFSIEREVKIVSVAIPEYTIEVQPDYEAIGSRIDEAIAENFEGTFLLRALSITDHPQYTLDQLTDIILKTGTDKYDPNRKGVDHEVFEPYRPDLQAGRITIEHGKIVGESFGADIKRFYENTLLDRGYRLRIDLLVLYDPAQMIRADKVDDSKPSIQPHLEEYLWRFKDPDHKREALVGMVKILR